MREILFRGKTEKGEWIEGFYHYSNLINPTTKELVKTTHWILPICGQDAYDVIPETVGQYTGLTDKSGEKIFEGDILQVITGDGWSCPKGTKVYYEVVFTEFNPENASWSEYIGYMAKGERGALRSLANVIRRYDAVVIGNIHDNPELLKGESKL